MRNVRVYIDQNIVGYINEGYLNFDGMKGVDWIYSNEHFNEIARSGNASYLSVFEKLKALQIEIVLDDKFRITNNATIHPYSSPHERYERYVEAKNDIEFDERIFTDLLTRLFGADNYRELSNLPERFKSQVEALLIKGGNLIEVDQNLIEKISSDLDKIIKNDLSETRSLESLRQHVGIDKGKIGNPKTDNPIQEIWEVIKDKNKGVTSDQFFGFDPANKLGHDQWPVYLGILGCHTILNFVGYRTDRGIATIENLPNIMSDASHIATAVFCDAVMSEDKRFCKKASAIYRYKNYRTQVLRLGTRNYG